MKSDYAIEITNLKKSYGDKLVLSDVSFHVPNGSIFCMLGSNGSGKTTTVKILSTLLRKDNGTVMIKGYNIDDKPDKIRQLISLTGQYVAIDDILTAKENMYLIAKLHHIADYKKRSNELLKDFNLISVMDKKVSEYSGGMRRRLDIAMCLLGNPSVIFLDEPTTGLDPQSRNSMWDIIRKLKESGVTIFLTTQYLEEAEQLADTVAILNEGVITAIGSVNEIKKITPNEYLSITLRNESDFQILVQKFSNNNSVLDRTQNLITIEIENGIEQMTDIFIFMRKQNLTPISVIQKTSSLEDVFLHLVDQKKGVHYAS